MDTAKLAGLLRRIEQFEKSPLGQVVKDAAIGAVKAEIDRLTGQVALPFEAAVGPVQGPPGAPGAPAAGAPSVRGKGG